MLGSVEMAIASETSVGAPSPNGPPPRPGVVAACDCTVASSVQSAAFRAKAMAAPTSAPTMPPMRPCTVASPDTCRTNWLGDQPTDLRVPSSRVRLLTEDSVRRVAINTAATSPTMIRIVPRVFEMA